MLLPLVVLFVFLPAATSNCHDHRYGVPSKSCKRVKDPKFQIRGSGIKIVPMWQFMLLKEPSVKRVRRSANATVSVGGQQPPFQQRAQLPVRQQNTPKPNIPHRQLLIQPIDSAAPPPQIHQRLMVQRQVQPSIVQPSSIFASRVSNYPPPPLETRRKVKRQELYATAPPAPTEYQETTPADSYKVTNDKEVERVTTNEKKSKKRKGKKGKGKGKKKSKTSKMCKMCKDLSSEENSEEKEVACELCQKAKLRKNDENGANDAKGLLQSALKVRPITHGKKKKGDESDESNEEVVEENEEDEEAEGEGGGSTDEYSDDDDESDGVATTTVASTTTIKSATISIPTIVDFVERAKQNKLMRIPVYRGKQLGKANETAEMKYSENGTLIGGEEEISEFNTNIRETEKIAKYSDKPNVKYSYPPKDTLPLQTCFHNPSGYVCCNLDLNNVVETTYKEIKEAPNFNPCNLQVIANKVQIASEKMFEHPFESIVAHADFAQNINFAGDLVCKLEIDGKYVIAYGTPYHAENSLGPQGPDGKPLPVRSLKL